MGSKEKCKKKATTKRVDNHLFDDMEDIFEDWAPLAFGDNIIDKKRKSQSKSHISNRHSSPPTKGKTIKPFSFELFEPRKPNNERRSAFARNQKRLNAKIFPKQPKKIS